ncbi:MAG: hypothetical protein GY847_42195 [Proteobacteria bacterium]|nr:hypothetical protein [Pseudomonadota bacterium]
MGYGRTFRFLLWSHPEIAPMREMSPLIHVKSAKTDISDRRSTGWRMFRIKSSCRMRAKRTRLLKHREIISAIVVELTGMNDGEDSS